MKLKVNRRVGGQVIVLLVIVLALLSGGYWWLLHSSQESEKEARAFAQATAARLAIDYDRHFLDTHMGQDAALQFPPSFRERMLNHFREFGTPAPEIGVTGEVNFTNQFFEPHGKFRAHLQYPTRGADLDLIVACPNGWWQIDYLNLSWDIAPVPAPAPATASPIPQPR
ncbi:MAG: hypothetical protein ABI992_06120 [Chthoniobacterales bacterium]